MRNLQPFQISLAGQHLVEASAGTGKTYNITSLFIRSLIEKEMDVDQILVLTYTKAATAELKERILSRVRESVSVLKKGVAPEGDEFLVQLVEHIQNRDKAITHLEQALHNFDEASIFTIHSFCQRALQEQSFLSGVLFDSELISDDAELVQEVIDDWWRQLVNRAEDSEPDRLWLNILREEGYLPEKLAAMVGRGLGKPYLKLDYSKPEGDSREEGLEELRRRFEELKKRWVGSKDVIEEQLLSDAMNGNRFRSTSVADWIEWMDHWLTHELPSLNLHDKFDRFSIEFIRNEGTKKGKEAPEHPFFLAVTPFLEQAQRVRSWLPIFKKDLLEETRRQVRDRKLSMGVFGYDDLLVLLHEALNREPQLADFLRSKFPIALVDEFQDTDPIQYEILTGIYQGGRQNTGLFLIGDPKQSIYSFRGADVFSYLNARDQVSVNQTYGLERNFRSDPDLIHAINAVFLRPEYPFMVDKIEFNAVTPADKEVKPLLINQEKQPLLRFMYSSNEESGESPSKGDARPRAAELAAESIGQLLNEGEEGKATIGKQPVRPRDIAVLVRTHKQAEMIRETLEKRSVKSVQYSEKSVFDTEEARNMELILQAVAEPSNEQAVRTVLATELFACDAHDLIQLEENEQQWIDKLAEFTEWNRLWQEHGFTRMFRAFLRDAKVEQHLVGMEQGERKLTNTLQLGELLQARQQEAQGGMFELIKWLARKRQDPDKSAEDEQLRLESDEELVRIVTMHRSKGLEYPIVYCPFLWDGANFRNSANPFLYHDEEDDHRASLDLNEKASHERQKHRYWSAKEEIAESLRLAYVAMTRAKHQCTVVFESASEIEFSPLGYLLLGKDAIGQQLERKIYSGQKADSLNPERYWQELRQFVSQHSDLIAIHSLNEEKVTTCLAGREQQQIDTPNRSFSQRRSIQSRAIVSSFSSIMHPASGSNEEPGDEIFMPEELTPEPELTERSMFTFPKGPQAGTCVHDIFEDLDFADLDNLYDLVESKLEQFGFDTEWTSVISQMVERVLRQELRPGVRLDLLTNQQLLKEMEFYYDLNAFDSRDLIRLIRQNTEGVENARIPEGFMKGYIDLIFRSGNQFYIADYKTNFLGDFISDYTSEKLQQEMLLAGYDVQYHIYTVALHRYLKNRVPSYSYKKHVGGVFYLFVRGMTEQATGGEGIFFDKPDQELIGQLDNLFKRREG